MIHKSTKQIELNRFDEYKYQDLPRFLQLPLAAGEALFKFLGFTQNEDLVKKKYHRVFLEGFPTYSQRPIFKFQFCTRVIVISDIGISRLITL